MEFKGTISILGTCAILAFFAASVSAVSDSEFKNSLGSFSQSLFSELFKSYGQKNIITSPFSIQTCLAMTLLGADGATAAEMERGLRFTGQTAESIADNYHSMLVKYENDNILRVANKVYVMEGQQLQDDYSRMLARKFFSWPENVDFGQSQNAAEAINSWVETKTNHTIKNLVSSDILSSDTRLLLLSAIYFKGEWQMPFPVESTKEDDFYNDATTPVKVQMMEYEGKFQMTRLLNLRLSAVRLYYKDSDLSMLVIMPYKGTSLAEMVDNLSAVPLKSLKDTFYETQGSVYLPKFKAEFEIEMTDTLKKMDMEQMFSHANFGKMLKSSDPLSVSKVVHKAFIEVTEAGTKAAAATGLVMTKRVMPTKFKVLQPFYYAIINEDFVPLFQGTIVRL